MRPTMLRILRGAALAAVMSGTSVIALGVAGAAEPAPTWRPEAAERLVKLPVNTLQKSLEYDFSQSPLGQATGKVLGDLGNKAETLGDLKEAAGRADGELRTELRHQLLVEKRGYVELLSQRTTLERKHLETRMSALEGVLAQLTQEQAAMTPARQELIENQRIARARLENTAALVDVRLLESTMAPQSKYSVEYAENFSVLQSLAAAIRAHPANAGADVLPATKRDAIRQMINDTHAELALVQQQEQIVGYMAKLIALDAQALSDEVIEAQFPQTAKSRPDPVRDGARYFIN